MLFPRDFSRPPSQTENTTAKSHAFPYAPHSPPPRINFLICSAVAERQPGAAGNLAHPLTRRRRAASTMSVASVGVRLSDDFEKLPLFATPPLTGPTKVIR